MELPRKPVKVSWNFLGSTMKAHEPPRKPMDAFTKEAMTDIRPTKQTCQVTLGISRELQQHLRILLIGTCYLHYSSNLFTFLLVYYMPATAHRVPNDSCGTSRLLLCTGILQHYGRWLLARKKRVPIGQFCHCDKI